MNIKHEYFTNMSVVGVSSVTITNAVADVSLQIALVIISVVVTPLVTALLKKLGVAKNVVEKVEQDLNIWTTKVEELERENKRLKQVNKELLMKLGED